MKEQIFLSDIVPEDEELAMGRGEIDGMSDPTEKLFAQIASQQGLLVFESKMIKLPGKKKNKWEKKSTVPDFIIKEGKNDEEIYVEVTRANDKSAKKNRQQKVMDEAGMGSCYVQITEKELIDIMKNDQRLIDYIKEKIIRIQNVVHDEWFN